MKLKKAIKVYFWIMAVSFPILLWNDVTDGEPLREIDYLDYIFWAVALAGVFGYCYSKSILNVKFWKLFLPFIVIWDAFFITEKFLNDSEILTEEFGIEFIAFAVLLYLLIVLPQYVAIYYYSYKHNTYT